MESRYAGDSTVRRNKTFKPAELMTVRGSQTRSHTASSLPRSCSQARPPRRQFPADTRLVITSIASVQM
jgi:hypothetical protein